MSFAIDANLLLYASDTESPLHERAVSILDEIALGPEIAYLFWPVAMAYLRIATHPAVFARPLAHGDARANLDSLLALSHVHAVGEDDVFWQTFTEVADDVVPTGNLVPDAHIVALMLANGVRTILTRDRDYRKFSGIRVRDPFAS
jgi:toxin-antitoxin system PIN domain toxin